MKTVRKNTSKTQPQQILTALFLTGIVSAGSGLTLLKSATAAPTSLAPQTALEMSKGNKQANRLPRPVANAVLRNLSRTARIPVRQLQIVEYSQQTWNNGCLELPQPDEACTQALVPGWRVVVSNGNQKWVYHTNRNGSNLRLKDANTPVSNLPANFSKSVANAVLQAVSQQLNVPTSQLKIVQAQQTTWSDGCWGLGRPEEGCLLAMVPGWRVVVESGKQRLVYHTNKSGSGVRLNEQASQIGDNNSRQKVSDAVLKMASQLTNLPTSQLKIVKFEEIIADGCLNLPQPDEACIEIAQKAWAVTVEGRGQLLVFHSTVDASQIRLNERASSIGNGGNVNLPQSIARKILAEASQQLNVPTSQLKIVQAQQVSWSDGCLGLGRPEESCLRATVPGWRVVVESGRQRLVYHTDQSGSGVRLNEQASQIGDNNSRQKVSDAVLKMASQLTNLPTSQLKVIKFEEIIADGCLNLPQPNEACTRIAQKAWAVTVEGRGQLLVFHSTANASQIRLNQTASSIALPQRVEDAVLRKASEVSGLPRRALNIVAAKQTKFADGCERPTYPNPCDQVLVSGWEVTVGSGQNRWVFLTDEGGFQVSLTETSGNGGNVNLPQSIARNILAEASAQTRLPVSQLQIVEVKEEQWSDSCLGVYRPEILCAPTVTAGWAVVVKAGEKSLVYHASKAGAIAFNEKASQIGNDGTIEAAPIPASELPLPLDQGVVFRQISSGGFAGRTYETVLRDDGLLIQVRIGDENDSERRVFRIPQQQVRQFQRLLERQAAQFNNISYPANGGADYITYTLTSSEGTVQYNDISQQNLPQNLQTVVEAWNEIIRRAQG